MPAAVGVILFMFALYLYEPQSLSEGTFVDVVETYFVMLFFAYVFVGIQSLLYAVAMEFYVNPKFKGHGAVVSISTAIGSVSGLVLGLPFALIGLASGCISGLCVRWMYINAAKNI